MPATSSTMWRSIAAVSSSIVSLPCFFSVYAPPVAAGATVLHKPCPLVDLAHAESAFSYTGLRTGWQNDPAPHRRDRSRGTPMRTIRLMLFSASLLLAGAAAHAGGMYRAGGKVLGPNDPAGKIIDTMGRPAWTEVATNEYGAQIGEYWYYREGSKTVRFFVSGGRIVDIEEIR
jgi:hypothetical protein